MTGSIVINCWSILTHYLFLDTFENMIKEVEARKVKDPANYKSKNSFKRLAAVLKLIKQDVPADPGSPAFRHGGTSGISKHWLRAKFKQQYRLFFQYRSEKKIIVFVWVNDETTKRTYGSKTDAYATFRSMLDNGNLPDDFDTLVEEAEKERDRLERALRGASSIGILPPSPPSRVDPD